MSKKVALCRVSDTEPLLSLVTMLEYAGYECVLPDRGLRDYLRSVGCANVDEFGDMRDRWGAEMPPSRLREIGTGDLKLAGIDLYVDVNAFHNGPLLWKWYSYLESQTLCYFINGGPPRNTPDKGDGMTPACPVMTTNQWYATNTFQKSTKRIDAEGLEWEKIDYSFSDHDDAPWRDKSYVFYPSFERWDRVVPRTPDFSGSPVCFCHNVMGWGYGEHVDVARELGCKFYGGGSSPDGLVRHEDVFAKLAKAPCVVYLKGGGAVDYAVLEAMAMGVPVVFPRQYVLDTLLTPLTGLATTVNDEVLIRDASVLVDLLRDPVRNFSLGDWGRQKVKDLCWQPERDGPGFVEWLGRMFP